MQIKNDGEEGQQGSDDTHGSCNNLQRRKGRERGAIFVRRGTDKNFPCRGENPEPDAGGGPCTYFKMLQPSTGHYKEHAKDNRKNVVGQLIAAMRTSFTAQKCFLA